MEGQAAEVTVMAIDPAIRDLCALALAIIFGASGAMKLHDLELFEGSLANYGLAPAALEKPLARLFPLLECAGAVAVLMPSTRIFAGLILMTLLAIFSAAIAINLARGRRNIDCGCFGPALRQELSGWLLLRNIFLLILAAMTMVPADSRGLEPLDFATIGLGAATLVILYASANLAIANAPKLRALEAM